MRGVCLASLSFYPLYAGPAVRFQRYAPGLRLRGLPVQVFTQAVTPELVRRDGSIQNGGGQQAQGETPLYEVVDGLPIHRVALPSGARRLPAYYRGLAQHCRRRRDEIGVVQMLNLDLAAAPWLFQLRRLGVPTVFTHTLLGDFSPRAWKRRLQRFHRRLPLALVDAVVVSSQAMRRDLLEMGVSTPVEVIPNGVDLRRFHPPESQEQRERLRLELGLDPGWQVVLAVGPVIPRKGAGELVQAFLSICGEFPRARLLMVGPRHDLARESLAGFHREMESAIAGAGAQERVIFTGPVSAVQLYYQAADLLVFPSRREGMPNVVPEAMASRLPVLLTPFTGLPEEFGKPGEQYLLTDWEPERLAADLRRLLSEPELRQRLGRAGGEWIECTMSAEKSLDLYAGLYARLGRG